MRSLADLPDGSRARVLALRGEPLLRERIMELGFTPGAAVELRGRAPFGDPIEVRVRGALVAVRRDEASCVEVTDEVAR